MIRVNSYSVLFSVKVIYFRVSILRRSVAILIVLEILINSNALNSFINPSRLILLEEFISINNYISIYKEGKFYY